MLGNLDCINSIMINSYIFQKMSRSDEFEKAVKQAYLRDNIL